jgi:hypothetical protein
MWYYLRENWYISIYRIFLGFFINRMLYISFTFYEENGEKSMVRKHLKHKRKGLAL